MASQPLYKRAHLIKFRATPFTCSLIFFCGMDLAINNKSGYISPLIPCYSSYTNYRGWLRGFLTVVYFYTNGTYNDPKWITIYPRIADNYTLDDGNGPIVKNRHKSSVFSLMKWWLTVAVSEQWFAC